MILNLGSSSTSDPAKGVQGAKGGGVEGRRRRVGKVAHATFSHCLPISPSRFSGSEEKRIERRKNDKRKTRVDLQARSCREKAGSLSHAATTTGLQKQTPHLLRWLLPRPTPRCHYVCLCDPSIHRHVHIHIHFDKLCMAAGHSNGKAGVSGGSHLADASDKARSYLPILAKGVTYKKFHISMLILGINTNTITEI